MMTPLQASLLTLLFFLPFISAYKWETFHSLSGCHEGDNRPQISLLKGYLRQFGYLPPLPSNLTDSPLFDSSLHKALLSYQAHLNLNLTGELDNSTLDLLSQPRCGVADISNGTRIHGRGLFSFFPGRPTWPRRKTQLTYSISSFNGLPSETVREIFSRAFSRWSEVIPLTFSEVGSGGDIRIGFYRGAHGDGDPFDGFLGTLAHAFSPPDGRLHLDGDENWAVTGLSAMAVDLESVMVHEIGHLLGLGHSSVPGAVMYPAIRVGTRRLELARDDVAGIQTLYGSNPLFNESAIPPARQGVMPEMSRAGGGAGLAVGVVALAALLVL